MFAGGLIQHHMVSFLWTSSPMRDVGEIASEELEQHAGIQEQGNCACLGCSCCGHGEEVASVCVARGARSWPARVTTYI